jgi:protein ImuA
VRNDVPAGGSGLFVPPSGVARAGGSRARVLIEHLRAQVRALEQVPVSLGLPPAPGAAPPRPACSLSSPHKRLDPLPLPPCGRAGPREARSEGGLSQTQTLGFTPLPTLPHKGRGRILRKLQRGGLHEIKPSTYRDAPAALCFALAVIAEEALRKRERRNLVLWCLTQEAAREWGRPYGPGLTRLGLDPALLLVIETRNAKEAAWALEEGLKARVLIAALAAVEIEAPLVARRLGLAAQASRTPCLLLSGHQGSGLPGTLSRWRIASARSGEAPFDAGAPGVPAWHLTLERCRGEAAGQNFVMELSDESGRFRLSPASCARTDAAGESSERRRSRTA